MRDRLTEVAAFMPNITAIDPLERVEEGPGRHRIVNGWRGEAPIPAAARRFVKPDMLRWTDRALWDESEWTCTWEQETAFFTDRVSCTGRNRFIALEPAVTRIEIRGAFELRLRGLAGLPGPLARRAAPTVERFIVGLITPNLEKTAEAVERFLSDEAR
ncbi:MAG: hypothetical protein JO265_16500 [Acidimicrobiia bacterium]|nr:hypothetical protein [Acidimicrobiia bacterium]